jgi:hypothetical protein
MEAGGSTQLPSTVKFDVADGAIVDTTGNTPIVVLSSFSCAGLKGSFPGHGFITGTMVSIDFIKAGDFDLTFTTVCGGGDFGNLDGKVEGGNCSGNPDPVTGKSTGTASGTVSASRFNPPGSGGSGDGNGGNGSGGKGSKTRAGSGASNPPAEIIGIEAEINPSVIHLPANGDIGAATTKVTIRLVLSNGSVTSARRETMKQGKWEISGSDLTPQWKDKDEDKTELVKRGIDPDMFRQGILRLNSSPLQPTDIPVLCRFTPKSDSQGGTSGGDRKFEKPVVLHVNPETPETTETSQASTTPPAPRKAFHREVE